MKPKNIFLFGMSIVIVWLFVSCQSKTEMEVANVSTVAMIQTSMPILSSVEPPDMGVSSTATATAKPTFTPQLIATETIVAEMITPTVIADILTPLPTLEGRELEIAMTELLENPMDCDVPCWWGFVPGITSLNEIKFATSPYNFHISEYEEDGEIVYLLLENKYVYNFSHSVLTGVTAPSPPIHEVLLKYGQPSDVWLATGITPDPMYIRLNLVYLQKGMAFGYRVVNTSETGESIKGCFLGETKGQLRLIASNGATSYKDFSPVFEADRFYLPLEKATNLTVTDFMEQFSDPTQPQCIETLTELWE